MSRRRVFDGAGLVMALHALSSVASAQSPQTTPIVVESVRINQPAREGLPREVAITVRNTGARTIEAWGVTGEVRYANGITRPLGVSTDTYETALLPEAMRPPAGVSKRLPPGGRATITASVPDVALVAPADAAAFPSFAIFEDDTAVGDEALIEYTFARRRVNQRAWRLADEALTTTLARGLPADQVLAAIVDAMNAADNELKNSVAFSILRRSMSSSRPSGEILLRLRGEVASRRAAADGHAERRR